MHVYHQFEHNGRRYRFVIDELYQTRGSYAYDTPEETKAAEDAEIEKLVKRRLGGAGHAR